ncbi:putative alpha-L-arabinofuranosidase [Actinoplanes missouriensis 431]|uniref:non-reducing end alpha-L-arabinofuranosidase n=1 Tax=Actinoplanes missouriensis (strain ATCC 14538 / DSM 43046 / CBS 188.64 / JCM 3121 / NBRC 102363 / NCIMB 12654 / NRRL B-3342 / UNCC 431) TaxID=512565 RepID=I0H9F4_ACTM4|nr:alpha-N-arabinofuranosidase [Actinoplanes missouriensis]BAL89641.1 putative alpha-L-arabinofuranosidase [Actinoplanes missouriensis 431]
MTVARLTLDPSFVVGPVDRRLFGSFVEHMGRCVYTGIFEPGHPRADADGLRTDVLDLVRELGVTTVRYPGGNFVSAYRWEDGVGPVGDRPRRLDLAWRSIESNAFGLNEFMRWAALAGVEPMMAVNLGTRGAAEAAELVEYCNLADGTAAADLRRKHGVARPHDIRLWCLGNEMDGPWQIGSRTAEEYGRLAAQAGHAMKRVDPSIELVACGSSDADMPTFAAWEATVLEQAYDQVDYLSLHTYYDPERGDEASFRASAVHLDGYVDDVLATADHVRARLRRTKRIRLALDEWNVWYKSRLVEPEDRGIEDTPALIEDDFTVTDAMVVGNLLISMLRHADRLTVGCQAQLVNIIAPIRTAPGGPAWRQTIFHPFAQTARLARGTVLRPALTAPLMTTGRFGDVPAVDAVATLDGRTLTVFAVNRGTEPIPLHLDLRAFGGHRPGEHLVLANDDPHLSNTAEHPERVTLGSSRSTTEVLLAPVSWHALSFTLEERQ